MEEEREEEREEEEEEEDEEEKDEEEEEEQQQHGAAAWSSSSDSRSSKMQQHEVLTMGHRLCCSCCLWFAPPTMLPLSLKHMGMCIHRVARELPLPLKVQEAGWEGGPGDCPSPFATTARWKTQSPHAPAAPAHATPVMRPTHALLRCDTLRSIHAAQRMGHGAWGMGHGAWGMGHGCWAAMA
jgi:hypothetical protein